MTSTTMELPGGDVAMPVSMALTGAEPDVLDLDSLYLKSGMLEGLISQVGLLLQTNSQDRNARQMLIKQYRALSPEFPDLFREDLRESVQKATAVLSDDATLGEIFIAASSLDRWMNLIDGRVAFLMERTAKAAAMGMGMVPMPGPMRGMPPVQPRGPVGFTPAEPAKTSTTEEASTGMYM